MTWFRRGGREHEHPDQTPEVDEGDSPDELRRRLWGQIQLINRSAGRLPVAAVVSAREITDTVREVIDTSAERELDVHAIVTIRGIVEDYLPTTLQAFLNLDESVIDRPRASGRTPREALQEQLDALGEAAAELLTATHAHDVDALFTQGSFLRTKFTASDLDL